MQQKKNIQQLNRIYNEHILNDILLYKLPRSTVIRILCQEKKTIQ